MTIVSVPALEVLTTIELNPSALLCHGYITEVRVYTYPMCMQEFLKYLAGYDLIRNTVCLHNSASVHGPRLQRVTPHQVKMVCHQML